ncbi:MAG: hypothetical protein OEU90_13125, partial [Gammaproteobacteria bacterium]|nr:hypothetical protein [Gammaproteobacteria bacterium]
MNKIKAIIAASVIPLLLIAVPAGAQSTGLTPQQELMINSLPPAQRQQALEALQQNKSGPALRVGERVQETVDTPSSALSPAIASFPVVETLRVSANSRLVVNFTPKESLSNNELQELQADRTLSRLSGSRTYVLDDNGVLSLLGIQSIPLLGLTEPDIERRLGAESLLSAFDIDARILET